jgi:hypothetical protein
LSSWSKRRLWAFGGAVGCAWVVALTMPRDFPAGIFGDDARYAVLAKSLRTEGRYRLLQIPGEPAETMYPPAYPALLALVWSPSRSDTANLNRLRWVNLALVGPLAGTLAVAGMEVFGLGAAASAALAVGGVAAPAVVAFWTLPLSEPLGLLLIAFSLVFFARGRGVAGAVLGVLAAYVRTIALAFLVGALLVRWRRGEGRKAAVEAAIAAAALVPWALWVWAHAADVGPPLYGMYGSYSQWYLSSLAADWTTVLFRVPAQNAWMILTSLGDALVGHLPMAAAVTALLGAALAWGVWSARRFAPALVAGLGLYALVVVIWPYPPARFVGAVWPLVLLAAAASLRPIGAAAVWAVTGVALVFSAVGFARGAGVGEGRRGQGWLPMASAIGPLLARDAVLASGNPALYYLALGVRGVPNGRMRSYRWYRYGFWATSSGLGDDAWAIVARYQPTHWLVERRGSGERFAAGSLIRQCPGVLTQIWSDPQAEYLFAVRSDIPCAPVIAKP